MDFPSGPKKEWWLRKVTVGGGWTVSRWDLGGRGEGERIGREIK